jgi:hypothetical protein
MMLLKADKRTEAGVLPTREDLEVMGKYNEELVKAGVLLDGVGLQNGKVHVTDGPFAETKELIAGYWMIKVASRAEAIEWAKRIPFAHTPGEGRAPEVELRQVFELEDFPDVPADVAEMEKTWGNRA